MEIELIQDRVQKGIEFLNKIDKAWFNKIDLGKFDIDVCTECILGQMFGNFYNATKHLKLRPNEDIALGFRRGLEGTMGVLDLNIEWKRRITQLQLEGKK